MKKSIKYAGIAAATLLAVAPVAAPVVSQAAETGTTATANEITNDNITTAVSALKGLMTNTTYGDNSTNGAFPTILATGNYDTYNAVASYNGTGILNGTLSDQNAKVLGASTETPKAADASMKVYAVDSNNNKINYTNYTTLYNDVSKNNGSIKYYYQIKYNNTDGDAQTPETGYFTLTNDNNYSEVKALNVSYTDPLNVAYGSKTVNAKLSTTIDGVVKDQNGNTIELDNDASTTVAESLYKSLSSAVKVANGGTSTDTYDDATFGTEDETYYQPVTITVKANKLGTDSEGNYITAKSIVDNYLAGEDNYSVTVNGSTMSATTKNTLGAADNTLTFIREVKVSQNASWTTEKVSGVVTTKNDASYYTLQNNDNKTITNRALQPNTAWKTNAVRTDANGNKQYRVATGEWINADSVTFAKDGDTSTGALTDITKVDGTATLDAGNYVYFLYNKDGKVLTNRSLMPGTAWHVINTAKDAEGNTYYRVATNEWLQQGTGVNYSNN